MSPIDRVLDRLASYKLKPTGGDRWRACCPAHGGSNPSALSIGIGDGGGVLLKCWHGCGAEDVARALGLELVDLFPPRPLPGGGAGPIRKRRMVSAAQALEILERESMVIFVVGADMARSKTVSETDHARLCKAMGRVQHIASESRT